MFPTLQRRILNFKFIVYSIVALSLVSFILIYHVKQRYRRALLNAIDNGDKKAIADILALGVDPNFNDDRWDTPLICAVESGNLEIIEMLLRNGARIGHRNLYNVTPLVDALLSNKPKVVRLLIDLGADPNLVALDGSPLMHALLLTDLDTINLLLQRGASVNVNTYMLGYEQNLLELACMYNHSNGRLSDALALLRSAGAVGSIRLPYAAGAGDLKVVRELVENGSNLEEKDDDGNTGLLLAVRHEHAEIVKELLDRGANPNVRDMQIWNCIFRSVRNDNASIDKFRELVSTFPGIRADRDRAYLSPLFYAVAFKRVDMMKLLLEHGADVNLCLWHHQTETALIAAVSIDRVDMLEELIRAGADVNHKFSDGATALHRAAALGRLEVVRVLLANGANVNVVDNGGFSPLVKAKECGAKDIVDVLLNAGAKF